MTAVLVEDGVDKGAIWHFGEPNKEQKAMLEGKAWADLSHLNIVAVSGADRLNWLRDLTTQHLSELTVGQWTAALILDPQGHVEYQFNLVDDRPSRAAPLSAANKWNDAKTAHIVATSHHTDPSM